jgi:hypothetical protein
MNEPIIIYDHIQDDLSQVSDHYVNIKKEKKAMSVWYIVYEEAIILSLLTFLLITTA